MNDINLFGKFGFKDEVDFLNFINTMGQKEAVLVLIAAVNYAQKKGLFELKESEAISVCLRKLSMEPKQSDVNQEGDNNEVSN